MSLSVWTSRVDLLGRDPDAVDVSRAGAVKKPLGPGVAFAPSWDLLQPFVMARRAREPVSFADYAARYRREMLVSYERHRGAWEALLARPRAVLCCYCTDPAECHRTLLARDYLPRLGAIYCGELPTALALSVRQPWAWALLFAGKDIENRTGRWWSTVRIPAEPILLHASAGGTQAEHEEAAAFIRGVTGKGVPALGDLPRGALVGQCRLERRVFESASPWFMGGVGLRVIDAATRPPVPCLGALGFFRVPWPDSWPRQGEKGLNIAAEEATQ